MAISFKGAHFPPDIILMGVRWYVAYPLSYRHVEALLEERGVPIAYSARKLPPIPYESCHRFHAKVATDSIAKLPRIPRQSCHSFHSKLATPEGAECDAGHNPSVS